MPSANPRPLAAIVGAGPGLGAALAKRFAAGGCDLALLSRHEASRAQAFANLTEGEPTARGYDCDAGDPASVAAAFAAVRKNQGDPSILIYNAGLFLQGTILELGVERFENAWKVNCLGALLAVKEAVPAMLDAGRGTVLLTGATAALRGGAGFSGLAVGKFGLRALAQSLSRECGAKGVHTAHVIIDGQIDSDATRARSLGSEVATRLEPAAIAETFWQLHQQPRSAWTQEMDLRPATEHF